MEDAAFISNLVSVLIDQPDRELRDIEDDDNFELMTFPDILLPRDRAFSWDVSLENDVSGELMAQQALDAYAKETADPKALTGNKRNVIPVFVKPENHVNLLNNYQPSNNNSKDSKSITSGGETVTVKVEGLNHSVGIATNHTNSYPDGSDDLFDQVDHILEPFLQDSVNQQFNNSSSQNNSVLPGADGNPTNLVTQNSLSQHSTVTSPYMTTTSTKDRSMGSSLSINGHLVKPKVTIKMESKPISSSKGPDIKKTNEILKGFDHSTSIYLKHDFDSNAAAGNNSNSNSTKRSLSTTSGTGSSSSSSGNTLVIPTMTSDIKRSPHMNLSMLQQQQQQSLGLNNNNTSMISNTNSSNLNGLPSLSSSNTGLNSLAATLNGNNSSNSGLSASSLLGNNTMNNNSGNNNNSLSIQSIHKVSSTGSMNNTNGLSAEYGGYNNPSSSLGSSTSGKLTSPYLVSTSSNSSGGVGGNTMGSNGNLVGNVNVNSKDADMMARNIMLSNAYNYADMLSMQQSSGNNGMMSNAGGAMGLNASLGSGISSPNMVHHHHLQQQQQQLHQHRYSPNLGMEMSPYMMNSNMGMNMTLSGGGGGLERRVGAYTIEERRIKIEKFRERKRQRIWRKQIKYDCRKRLADTRPRVKGRFVSRKNLGSNNSLDAQDGQMSPDGKDYHDAVMDLGEGSDDDNSTGGLPQHHHHHQSNLHHHQSGLNVNIHGSSMAMSGLNNMSNMHNMNGTSMNNMSSMSGMSGGAMSMNGLNSMNVAGIGGIGTGSVGVLSGGTSGLNSMIGGNLSHGSSHHTNHNHHTLNQHHLHQHQHHQNHQHTHHLHSNNNHSLNLHHQQQQQHHQSQQQQHNSLSSSADMILEFPPELPTMVSMGTLGPTGVTTTNTGSLQSPSAAASGTVTSSTTSSIVGNSLPNALNS